MTDKTDALVAIDVLATLKREIDIAHGDAFPAGRKLIAVHAAVKEVFDAALELDEQLDGPALANRLRRALCSAGARSDMKCGKPTPALAEQPAGAVGEGYKPVLCVKCGHPTMHIGHVCFACSRESRGPQPDGGDGAVACVVNGYLPRQRAVEVKLDFDVPEWITKNPGVRAYLSSTRPSAAAAVPERIVLWSRNVAPHWYFVAEKSQRADIEGRPVYETLDPIVLKGSPEAAPAAPKGGVVVVARELAEKVQDALGRFVGDEGWCGADMETADAFSAALAEQEEHS